MSGGEAGLPEARRRGRCLGQCPQAQVGDGQAGPQGLVAQVRGLALVCERAAKQGCVCRPACSATLGVACSWFVCPAEPPANGHGGTEPLPGSPAACGPAEAVVPASCDLRAIKRPQVRVEQGPGYGVLSYLSSLETRLLRNPE